MERDSEDAAGPESGEGTGIGGIMWSDVVALYRNYMGTGLIVIWFVISLVYLWVNEKRTYMRILFLYLPVITLALFFNPLFALPVYRMLKGGIYYRILWLLPITPVLAYTCASICGRFLDGKPGNWKKKLLACAYGAGLAGMIAVSGSYIYSNPNYIKAQNMYHVPDAVVHVCDAIRVPGREVMAVFPLEMVQYVRQYSPYVCMPYGRDMFLDVWNDNIPLCNVMEAEIVDMERLVPLVRAAGCHYCILRADKPLEGNPEDYGWVRFGEMDGFVIYRDMETELIIPDV